MSSIAYHQHTRPTSKQTVVSITESENVNSSHVANCCSSRSLLLRAVSQKILSQYQNEGVLWKIVAEGVPLARKGTNTRFVATPWSYPSGCLGLWG